MTTSVTFKDGSVYIGFHLYRPLQSFEVEFYVTLVWRGKRLAFNTLTLQPFGMMKRCDSAIITMTDCS